MLMVAPGAMMVSWWLKSLPETYLSERGDFF
jgi:hypothetical protein